MGFVFFSECPNCKEQEMRRKRQPKKKVVATAVVLIIPGAVAAFFTWGLALFVVVPVIGGMLIYGLGAKRFSKCRNCGEKWRIKRNGTSYRVRPGRGNTHNARYDTFVMPVDNSTSHTCDDRVEAVLTAMGPGSFFSPEVGVLITNEKCTHLNEVELLACHCLRDPITGEKFRAAESGEDETSVSGTHGSGSSANMGTTEKSAIGAY
mmetsp:Transcript_23789/g.66664  ORF Transcript_23789/g.66664 Transcript_23789/m.66664 type:complete len:207 (+) Transcript_23789:151-771(+)|eukprot:CAMPEP_0119128382 /NCGR_PEP_ID=MMETSP1310-20130426/6561_1 /TAXON_ID=464262 /ORGANISM="Genus nov. species nov., Strain RCC2339" /LENGTH=206 /DNA_ID=CAMNT_0007118717 /DNA_START=187 /DNA_END=807 /DNA_ORIENTATION=+